MYIWELYENKKSRQNFYDKTADYFLLDSYRDVKGPDSILGKDRLPFL